MGKLVARNLLKHPIRSLLTVLSLVVALFLLCFLRSVLTTLEAGIEAAASRRLWVQSAVSLFVDLPLSYQPKIEAVDGVDKTCKWQWFGGYYRERTNFFAQFACDPEALFEMWPEIEIVAGSKDEFLSNRSACLLGKSTADEYGFRVGDVIPITGALFPNPSGPYEFEVAAIYRSTRASLDDTTMFFHWEFHEKTQEALTGETPDVGVFVLEVAPGVDPTGVMASVDALFENGPQRVQTTTEAQFSLQFVTMLGNVPRLVGAIGLAVLFAILLACVNTMLIAAREQTRDVGIMKALGFTNGSIFRLQLLQSLALCCVGGGLGILLAYSTQDGFAAALGSRFPGYTVKASTLIEAGVVTVLAGLLAGLVPARNLARLLAIEALRRQ